MPPSLATIVFATGIWGLFILDRDRELRTSRALWIPTAALLISGSRPLSEWLVVFGFGDSTQRAISPAQFLEGSPFDRNVFLCLIVLCLIVLARRRRQVKTLFLTNRPILLFFVYCALSVLWSEYSFVAFKRWVKGVLDLLLVFVVLSEPRPQVALNRLLSRIAFILVPLSVLLIKYYPEFERAYNRWTWLPMHSGVSTTKNELGMLCLLCGVGSIWHFVNAYRDRDRKKRTQRLAAHGTILALGLWLLWIADSMTSLACFIVTAALIVVTSVNRVARKPVALHLLVVSVVGVSAAALFFDPEGTLISTMGRDPTLTGRTYIWGAVVSFSGNPWVGTGYESFWAGERLTSIWARTMDGINEAHNGYLEVYLNLGWVGVTLLSGLIVTGYRNVITAFRSDQDSAQLNLAFFVVALIYNLTEAGFRQTTFVWVFFLSAITVPPKTPILKTTRCSYDDSSVCTSGYANHSVGEVGC
jgi:O-antigen ligase